MLIFAAAAVCEESRPVLEAEDRAFLEQQARRVAESARLEPGQASGKWRNRTAYTLRVPGGNMGYPAFWVRDAVMMLGGDLIPAGELEGWIRLVSQAMQGPQPWRVHPGAVVPAFAVPDHINFDGKPVFYPGTYETGDKQGGEPFGKYPPLDDHFYFVTAVYRHFTLTGSPRLFQSAVESQAGQMFLSDLCERAYHIAGSDPETGLVLGGETIREDAKDFGFCDTVFKTGKLLFTSTLKFLASQQLAELFQAIGRPEKAGRYQAVSARIRQSLPATFFHATRAGEGWLHSATGLGNQPDVWGSAFAIWAGAVDGEVARSVARSLVRAYREKTAVRNGFVRHIPTSDAANGGAWQKSITPPGEYQNGGYWGTPAGWYIAAVNLVDPQAARDLARDYIRNLRDRVGPDGLTEALEWFNPDTGKGNNPLYVATVGLPYLSLLEAGLLGGGTEAGGRHSGKPELKAPALHHPERPPVAGKESK